MQKKIIEYILPSLKVLKCVWIAAYRFLWHGLAAVFIISTIVLFILNYGVNTVSAFDYDVLQQENYILKYNLSMANYQLQLSGDREANKQAKIELWQGKYEKEVVEKKAVVAEKYKLDVELTGTINGLRKEVATLQNDLFMLNLKLQASEKRSAGLGGQIFYERDQYKILEEKYTTQFEQYNGLITQYNDLKFQYDKLKLKYEALQQEYELLKNIYGAAQ